MWSKRTKCWSTCRWGPCPVHCTGAVERATTPIGYDVNKPVKSSLHSKKVKSENIIVDSSISIKIINIGKTTSKFLQ